MSIQVSFPSDAFYKEFTENTNCRHKVRLARHLRLHEGRWEVGLVDMYFSNTWRNVTDGKLSFRRRRRRKRDDQIK